MSVYTHSPLFPTTSHYYRPPRSSLTSPTRSNISSPTGSPTRSRQNRLQALLASDPLLSRLTPATIYHFAHDPELGFTAAEKEWSVRAADGIVRVGEWLREVEGWNLGWRAGGRRGSNGRDMAVGYLPPLDRPKKRRKVEDGGMGCIKEVDEDGGDALVVVVYAPETPKKKVRRGSDGETTPTQKSVVRCEEESDGEEEEYWGSLPKSTVEKYEARIAFIKSEIEELDIETLKSKVLSYRTGATNPLTDSSAIITATTLQLLPPLHRLTKLLSLWTVRLAVLRVVPVFLHWLDTAKDALAAGYAAITHPSISPGHSSSTWRGLEEETYMLLQETITQKVATAGRLMDTMLDALEGREDVLPDVWISELEEVEEQVGAWEMDGERVVLEGRLRLDELRSRETRLEEAEREREKTALVMEVERSAREAERAAVEVDGVMERAEETERGLREAMEANDVVAEGIELGEEGSPVVEGGEWGGRELLMRLESVERTRMERKASVGSESETDGEWSDAREERARSRWGSFADLGGLGLGLVGGVRGHGMSLEPVQVGRRSSAISTGTTPFMTPMSTPWFVSNGYALEMHNPRDVAPVRPYPVVSPAATQVYPIQNHPAVTQVHPATVQAHPAVTQNHPAVTQTHPAVVQVHPSTQVHPATTQVHPSTTQIHPSTIQVHPSTTQAHPSTTQIHPSTTQIHPSTIQVHPSTTQVHPTQTQVPDPQRPSTPKTPTRTLYTPQTPPSATRTIIPQTPPSATRTITNPRTPSPKAHRTLSTPPSPEIIRELPYLLAAARTVFHVEKKQEIEREQFRESEKVLNAQIKAEEKERRRSRCKSEEDEIERLAELETVQFLEDCEKAAVETEAEDADEEWSDEEHTGVETRSKEADDLWAAAEEVERKQVAEAARKAREEAEYRERIITEKARAEVEAGRRKLVQEKETERRRRASIERVSSLEAARLATEAEHQRILAAEAALIVEEERQKLAEEREAEAERQRLAKEEAERLRLAEEEAERERIAAAAALAAATAAAAAEAEFQRRKEEAAAFAIAEGKRIEAEAKKLAEEEAERRRKAETERLAAIEAARVKAEEEVARIKAEEEAEHQRKLEAERLAAIETARLAAEVEAKAEAERLRLAKEAEEAEQQRVTAAKAAAEVERKRKLEAERLAAIEAARIAAEAEAERLRLAKEAEAEQQRIAAAEAAAEAEAEAERQRKELERSAALEAIRLEAEAAAKAEAKRLEKAERQRNAAAAEAERQQKLKLERLAALETIRLGAEAAAEAKVRRLRLAEEGIERQRIAAAEAAAEAERQRDLEFERLAAIETARLEAEHQRLFKEEAERQRIIDAKLSAEAERKRKLELEQLAALEAARLAAEAEAEAELKRLRLVEEEAELKWIVAAAAEVERQRFIEEEATVAEVERQQLIEEEAERYRKHEIERFAALEAARREVEAEAAEETRRAEVEARQHKAETERRAAIEARRQAAEQAGLQRMVAMEAERRKTIEEEARRNAEAHAEAVRLAEVEVARRREEELEILAAIEAARIAEEEAERERMQVVEAERLRAIKEESERQRLAEIEQHATLEAARAEAEAERRRVEDQRKAEANRRAALSAAKETERQRRLAAEVEAEAERDISAGLEALRVAKAAESKRLANLKAASSASEVEALRLAALEDQRLAYERSKQSQLDEDAALAAALAEADRLEAEEYHDSDDELEQFRLKTQAWALQQREEEEEEEKAEQERILAILAAAEAEEARQRALEAEEMQKRAAAQQAEWDAEDEEERRLVAAIQAAAAEEEAEYSRQEALAAEELRQRVAAQEAQWEAEEEEEQRILTEARRVEEERWAAEEEADRKHIAMLQKEAAEAAAEAEGQEALEEEEHRQRISQQALWDAEEEQERQMLAAIKQPIAEAEAKEEQRLAEEKAERLRLQAETEAATKAKEDQAFEERDRQRRLAEDERQRLADLALAEQERLRLEAQEAERLKMEKEIEETRVRAELEREEEERRRQEALSSEKHTGSNSEGGSISGDDVTEEYQDISHAGKSLLPKEDDDSEGEIIRLSKSQTSQPSVPPPSVEMTPVPSRSPSIRGNLGWSPPLVAVTPASRKPSLAEVDDSSEFESEVDTTAAENRATHNSLQQALNDSGEYELPRNIISSDHPISDTSFIDTPSIFVAPSTPQKSLELDDLDHTPKTAIWNHSANSPVFDEIDSFEPFPSDMTIDESRYQELEDYGQEEDSSDFDMAPLATSTPKPARRMGRLSGLDSITEVLTPHSPREQVFRAPDGSPMNDTPSKRGKRQDQILPDEISQDNEDSGGSSGERSNDRRQWAPIPLNMPARPGSAMSNKSSMSNVSLKKRAIPEPKPPIKAQRSQRFIRKAPLDMGRPRSLSSTSDRLRPSSSASDYGPPSSTTSTTTALKGLPKVPPKVVPKGSLGPAMKAIRRPRKDIDSDDESVAEEPRWSRGRENTPEWASSPPTPNLGVAPRLNVTKKNTRPPSNMSGRATPDKRPHPPHNTPHKQEDSAAGPHRPPKLEFPQASLDDKVNEILTALASPIRLTASNLQKLTETTSKRQPPLGGATGIPAPRSIGSTPSVASGATSFSRGGRQHVPNAPGDIKLYHLHRSDGQAPIKLYIRLVGERGERVMVRVGGGWADLAEYLKEYAAHHGSKRRAVSGGRIEIQDLGGTAHHHTLHPSRSISSLRSASPAPGSRSSSPLPVHHARSRSSSAVDHNRRSESPIYGRRAESPSLASPPPAVMRGGHNGTLPTKDLPVTPTLTAFQPLTYQRQSGLSPPTGPTKPQSRPGSSHSTAGATRRPTSRLSFTESAFDSGEMGTFMDAPPLPKPLGLAGPKGKNSEISPENQAWVEGMIGEVRKVSANRRRRLTGGSNNGDERDMVQGIVELQPGVGQQFGGRLEIGEMGKQGATRRVFPKKQ